MLELLTIKMVMNMPSHPHLLGCLLDVTETLTHDMEYWLKG